MNIDILCSDPAHPVNNYLKRWIVKKTPVHQCRLVRNANDLRGGDILFLVSCTEIIGGVLRDLYTHALVLHASALPAGRGWSPHIWEILSGAEKITVCVLEAHDELDSGPIWASRAFPVPDHALYDEIHDALFQTELSLMDEALELIAAGAIAQPQATEGASYWPRRHPNDSELDPEQSLSELFDSIRVADPDRYPAFFKLRGQAYSIVLRKRGQNEDNQD